LRVEAQRGLCKVIRLTVIVGLSQGCVNRAALFGAAMQPCPRRLDRQTVVVLNGVKSLISSRRKMGIDNRIRRCYTDKALYQFRSPVLF
jgi:hypothetical protein